MYFDIKAEKKDFYVIAVISNPARYASRYDLYFKFAWHMQQAGVNIITVETAFGDRPFEVTSPVNVLNLQLRSNEQLWHKENMINLGLAKLPSNWKYVAWIDADIQFVRPDWVDETIHQLQHYEVVQMFQNAVDLGPAGETLQIHKGFMYSYQAGLPIGQRYETWHPGFAWAATRKAINGVGRLIDISILGSGDRHMAAALVGKVDTSVSTGMHPNYIEALHKWQNDALTYIKKDVGYVPGTILHSWHGKKANRQYKERWKILVEHQFDPFADLRCDYQGLYQLEDEKIGLRDDIRNYFLARNEDSIDNS